MIEDTKPLRRFVLLGALFVLVVSSPAILQLIRTGGYLYYRNGADETSYLQYGTSVHTQGISRVGQYVVTGLHRVGLSGGFINFVLDATLPLVLLLLMRAIGRAAGLTERSASGCAFLLVVGPLVFNAANPIVEGLFKVSAAHGLIRYVAMPDGVFLPVLRSPEPQVSLVLLGVAILLALRWRSFIPVYVALPFLYPFIAVAAAFVTIGLTIRSLPGFSRLTRGARLGPVAAYLIVSAGAGAMLTLSGSPAAQQHLVSSRLPLVSMTSVAALLGWFALRRRLEPGLRSCALLLALAPLAACNIHVVTGWLVAPSESELYAGSAVAALLCGCALFAQGSSGASVSSWVRAGRWMTLAVVMTLFARVMIANVRDVLATPLLTEPVLEALRSDAGRVVWSDGRRARLLALVSARQKATALDYGQTFMENDPAGSFERYLAVRRAILDDPRRPVFRDVLAALDAGYAHDNEDQLFSTSGRDKLYSINRNVPLEAARRSERAADLIYIVERRAGWLELDR